MAEFNPEEFETIDLIESKDEKKVLILYDDSEVVFLEIARKLRTIYCFTCETKNVMTSPVDTKMIFNFINDNKNKQLIIHYTGHGQATNGLFPCIRGSNKNIDIQQLIMKHFKNDGINLLVLIDACNGLPIVINPISTLQFPSINLLFNVKNINFVSSCRKGNYSYYSKTNLTTHFFEAFEGAIQQYNSNHKELFKSINEHLRIALLKENLIKHGDHLIIEIESPDSDTIKKEIKGSKDEDELKKRRKESQNDR